jgi:hypothetical protein
MERAVSFLGLANHLYEQHDAIFNRMALTKISDKQFLDYVNALVPEGEDEADNAKIQEIRNACLKLHESGQGADLSRGDTLGGIQMCNHIHRP